MKRSDKILFSVVVLGVAAVCGFAAFVGVTRQQRDAARANMARPNSVAVYEALVPEEAAESGGSAHTPEVVAEAKQARQTIDTFAELFRRTIFTENDPQWGELLDWLGRPRSEWPEGMEERLYSLVAMIAPLLDDVRALAAQGGPVQALDFSQGYAMELPHLRPMRNLGNVLRADAIVAADARDFDRVVNDIIATMQLGDALAEEPVLFSQLVRIALYRVAMQSVWLLPPDTLAQEHYDRLMDHMTQAARRDQFADCFAGEALSIQAVFEDRSVALDVAYPESARPGDLLKYGYERAYASPLGKALTYSDEAAAMTILNRIQEAARLQYIESRAEEAAIETMLEELSWRHIITRTMLSGLTGANRAQARHEAILGVTQLGLAVERFQRAFGEYPEALDLVADQFPERISVDPFTGASFVYRVSENGFVLYSVGMNLTDDNGRHDLNSGDIVWRGAQE